MRWRLTAWVAAVLLVAAGVLFIVVYQQTGVQLRDQIDRDIRSDAATLGQNLSAARSLGESRLAATARYYVNSQPYTAASRLLFVLLPGQGPISNHPEVFGNTGGEAGESKSDQSIENEEGGELLRTRSGFSVHALADAGPVRVFVQRMTVPTGTVIVGAGEPLELVERAQHSVAMAFAIAGALIALIALVASYLAGAHVSAPLRQMAAVATRVDAGDLAPRMETGDRRSGEVQVLADAFNHMLDRLAEAFSAQRAFVADASHELRTPLTVIRGQLEVLAVQENPSAAEIGRVEQLVQAEVSRISRLVDDLLLLAQAERTDFLRPETIDVHGFVTDLWDGLSHMADRRFEIGPVPTGTLHADPDRLAQAVGNLVRNAVEHTAPGTGMVRLEVRPAGAGRLRFTVIDDGPGIPASERERVFERFRRTDASRTRAKGGAGLGLSIVRAIAEAHGGSARVDPAAPAGARVEIVLPEFTAARDVVPVHRYSAPR